MCWYQKLVTALYVYSYVLAIQSTSILGLLVWYIDIEKWMHEFYHDNELKMYTTQAVFKNKIHDYTWKSKVVFIIHVLLTIW